MIQFYGVMQWPVGKPARFMQRLLRDGAIEGEPAGRYGWRFRFTDPARQRDLLAWLGPGLDAEAPGVEREWNGSGTGAAPE